MKRAITLMTILLAFAIFAMPTHAENAWYPCTPVSGAYYVGSRLHVKCSNPNPPGDTTFYFALSTSTTSWKGKTEVNPEAETVMNIITTAIAEGKTINILCDIDDESGADIGCQTIDCRLMKAIEIEF